MDRKSQWMNICNTKLDEYILTSPRTPDLSAKRQEGVYLEHIYLNRGNKMKTLNKTIINLYRRWPQLSSRFVACF